MPKKAHAQNILYSLLVVVLIVVCGATAYYIGVNTVLSKRVLPHVSAGNVDVSLLSEQDLQTKLDNLILSQLPATLHVMIDEYTYDVPITELEIKADESALQYGKGSDMVKVVSQAIGLIGGTNIQLDYTINPLAVLKQLPVNLRGDNPAEVVNGVVKNCDTKEFSVGLNVELLTSLTKAALNSKTELKTTLAAIADAPQNASIINYCTQYNQQIPILNAAAATVGTEGKALFQLQVASDQTVHWQLTDENQLRSLLQTVATKANKAPNEGRYEVSGANILLLENYSVGHTLNIAATIDAVNAWLASPTSNLPLKFDDVQPKLLSMGKTILDFTKHLAVGKTRIDIIRENHPNWVLPYAQYGLEEMQNMIIQPHATFSFIDQINPQPGGWTQEGRPIGAGICNSTTTLFRAVLEAGFPITDRSYHPTNIGSYDWGYPMNLVDAAYLTSPRVDLKFINDLDYPVLLKFSYSRPGDNWQYHTLDVYTSPKTPDRKVVIDNFKKWNVQSDVKYEGSFDRHVYDNGNLTRQDNFYSKYN